MRSCLTPLDAFRDEMVGGGWKRSLLIAEEDMSVRMLKGQAEYVHNYRTFMQRVSPLVVRGRLSSLSERVESLNVVSFFYRVLFPVLSCTTPSMSMSMWSK